MECVLAGARLPARLLNLSFAGLQGRLAPDDQQALDGLEAVRIEDLPALPVTVQWQKGELFGVTFDAPDEAGRVIAGFLEIFVPPPDAPAVRATA